ncbi:hypothetical protein [Gimesia maris]|nr:hypothetical protein [Gimesia maris]EDL58028.1 hypothetical protein PM8797T_15561 [Gimesia maris DSM 8797]
MKLKQANRMNQGHTWSAGKFEPQSNQPDRALEPGFAGVYNPTN